MTPILARDRRRPLRLKKRLARDAPLDDGDTIALKEALGRTGDYTPPRGVIDAVADGELIDAVRRFQKRHGLRQDGEARPGGATERLLRAALGQGNRAAAARVGTSAIGASVGALGRNDPADVATVAAMLAVTGHLDKAVRSGIRDPLPEAIGRLQDEHGAKVTRTVAPDDPILGALRREVALHRTDGGRAEFRAVGDLQRFAQSGGGSSGAAVPLPAPRGRAAPPSPKRSIFRDNSWWPKWLDALDRAKLSDLEKLVFREIFAFEGGLSPVPNSNTRAGITTGTLKHLAGKRGLPSGKLPKDLSIEEMVNFYLAYFEEPNTLGRLGNFKALEGLGNPRAVAATADSLFRHGPRKGAEIIQKAINATARARGVPERVVEDASMGKNTFDLFKRLMQDEEAKRILSDQIAASQIAAEPDEAARANYFRFQ